MKGDYIFAAYKDLFGAGLLFSEAYKLNDADAEQFYIAPQQKEEQARGAYVNDETHKNQNLFPE